MLRQPQVGTLVSVSADSVVMHTGMGRRADVTALPRRTVSAVELGFDSGHHTWRGATIGAVAGALTGVGAAYAYDCEDDEYCEDFKPLVAVLAGGSYAIVGLLVGGVIGRLMPRVEWVPVPLPERVGLAPTGDGALAVRLTLRM